MAERYVNLEQVVNNIDNGGLLVGNNAECAKEAMYKADHNEVTMMMEKFYDAWMFLSTHKMFRNLFECGLYTVVVKVNPETDAVDDDDNKNTKVQIWLEHGPYEIQPGNCCSQHTHDWDLDCGGDTFEDAVIKLAELVKKHYNNDGSKKSNEVHDV